MLVETHSEIHYKHSIARPKLTFSKNHVLTSYFLSNFQLSLLCFDFYANKSHTQTINEHNISHTLLLNSTFLFLIRYSNQLNFIKSCVPQSSSVGPLSFFLLADNIFIHFRVSDRIDTSNKILFDHILPFVVFIKLKKKY